MTDKLPSTHRRDKKMACEPERYMVKNKKKKMKMKMKKKNGTNKKLVS